MGDVDPIEQAAAAFGVSKSEIEERAKRVSESIGEEITSSAVSPARLRDVENAHLALEWIRARITEGNLRECPDHLLFAVIAFGLTGELADALAEWRRGEQA